MAILLKPNNRGAEPQRCKVSAFRHRASYTFEVGPPHIVIEITLPSGMTGHLELTEEEWQNGVINKLPKAIQ
jgi:hypothetical protein